MLHRSPASAAVARAVAGLVAGLAVIVAVGLFVRPDAAREVAFQAERAASQIAGDEGLSYSTLRFEGPDACRTGVLRVWTQADDAPARTARCAAIEHEAITLSLDGGSPVTREIPSGFSLLPPLLAILLAFVTRRVIPALAAAIVAAALMAADFAPVASVATALEIVEPSVTSLFNLSIYAFTLFLIGMVGIQLRSGGLDGLIDLLARRATGRRSAQAATVAMGGAVFFDDYANSVVVGASARPLTDRFRISREKLAYLVDSTAAPISGVAMISTWVGFEIGLFNSQLVLLGDLGTGGYDVFFSILPYRFYCILSVVMVVLVALTGRDFGPMLKAERRALAGQPLGPNARPMATDELTALAPPAGAPRRWQNGVLPIGVVLAGVLLGYAIVGFSEVSGVTPFGLDWWQAAFSVAGDAMDGNLGMYILLLAAIAGALTAAGLAMGQRILTGRETAGAFWQACRAVLPTLVILALAIAIREATAVVQADELLVTLIGPMDLMWLPLAVFLLAALTAFSTGTSWGTMGILMPVVVPLVASQVAGAEGGAIVLGLSLAAVLDGAIFGDHCSPISDTTVMSSMASACDHIDHVRTQLPYATLVMLAAGFGGYVLVAATGVTSAAAYTVGALGLAIFLFVIGRRTEAP